jgi:glycosyltransferase involved in cell wall biosynthesis
MSAIFSREAASNPKVSLLMPMYNSEKYLATALMSAVIQTYQNLEIIVVDDGSVDASHEIATAILSKFGGESKIVKQTNSGEASADNLAFSLSSGDFVIVLNSDDLLHPDCIESCLNTLLENPKASVAYPDWDLIDSDGRLIKRVTTPEYAFESLVGSFTCLPGPGALIRKSSIRKPWLRDPSYRYINDFRMWLDISLVSEFVRVPAFLAAFRVHGGQQGARQSAKAQAEELVRCHRTFFSENIDEPRVRAAEREALAMAHYFATLQSLNTTGFWGVKHSLKSIFTIFHRSKNSLKRRSFVALVLGSLGPAGGVVFRGLLRIRNFVLEINRRKKDL